MPGDFASRVAFYRARRRLKDSPRRWLERLQQLATRCGFSEDEFHRFTRDVFIAGFEPRSVRVQLEQLDSNVGLDELVRTAEDILTSESSSIPNNQYRSTVNEDTDEEDNNEESNKESDENEPEDYKHKPDDALDIPISKLNLEEKAIPSTSKAETKGKPEKTATHEHTSKVHSKSKEDFDITVTTDKKKHVFNVTYQNFEEDLRQNLHFKKDKSKKHEQHSLQSSILCEDKGEEENKENELNESDENETKSSEIDSDLDFSKLQIKEIPSSSNAANESNAVEDSSLDDSAVGKDRNKYEACRKMGKRINEIREDYNRDLLSENEKEWQRGLALYFLDNLVIRPGHTENNTTGCFTLRIEHIKLDQGQIILDFIGKSNIRYYNKFPVDSSIFVKLQKHITDKEQTDPLFDEMNARKLNQYLKKYDITAKDFRTYNCCKFFESKLKELTDPEASEKEKKECFKLAYRAAAILCNHQLKVENKQKKIEKLRSQLKEKMRKCEVRKQKIQNCKNKEKKDQLMEHLKYLTAQINELESQITDILERSEDDKMFNVATGKVHYLDPRIAIAWLKKHGIGFEKKENNSWANEEIENEEDFVF